MMEALNFGYNSNGVGVHESKAAASEAVQLPPGYRFHPTDEELITHYLVKKVIDRRFTGPAIADVDLNKCEPWDLPEKAKMGEKEWYFFSLRDRKYPTGLRTNRATEAGYWKATGKDREIFNPRTNSLVGMKKTLVFYKGRAPKGEKSNWVMHEYRLEGKFSYHDITKTSKVDEWVICRIFQKNIGGKKNGSSSLGGFNRHPYIDDAGSASPPPLSADSGSVESEGSRCARDRHVSCFSTATTHFNSPGQTHRPATLQDLPDIDSFIRSPQMLQNLGINDPTISFPAPPARPPNLNPNTFPPVSGLSHQPPPHFPFLLSQLPSAPFQHSAISHPPLDNSVHFQNLPGLTQNSNLLRALAGHYNDDHQGGAKQPKLEASTSLFENKPSKLDSVSQWLQRGINNTETFNHAQAQQSGSLIISGHPDTVCLNTTHMSCNAAPTHSNPADLDWIWVRARSYD